MVELRLERTVEQLPRTNIGHVRVKPKVGALGDVRKNIFPDRVEDVQVSRLHGPRYIYALWVPLRGVRKSDKQIQIISLNSRVTEWNNIKKHL